MKKFFLPMLIFLFVLAPGAVEAGKKDASTPPPAIGASAQAQQAFTEQYWQAVDAGTLNQLWKDVVGPGPGISDETRMLQNFSEGKAADGSERKGFRGDPNDPGPQDWSDYDVKTDKDGNVTGIEEKDFEAKDTDKDGEISDAERAEWDKKKAKENEEAGGAPGEV